MNQIRRRKRYFIKPGFQSRLTAIFILIVIIVANIVGALVYGFSIEKLENKLVVESKLPIDTSQLGQALLPGVVMLRAGLILAERALGRPLRPLSLSQAKFTRPVQPDQRVGIHIQARSSLSGLRIRAQLTSDHGAVASFTFDAAEV